MNRIHVLAEDTIATIAAGQVIDRPVSVVKELVDNALDAGGTYVTVDLEKGGIQRIVVTDNGLGMSERELMLCFLPHTTSKLTSISDLQTLQTLGFRGEGLASMVAVAQVEIASRQPVSPIGAEIMIKKGKVSPIRPIGMPSGTRVAVAHIFKDVPARKKFLKKDQTELRYILELINRYALTYPKTTFVVSNNGTVVLRTQHHDHLDRINELTLVDVRQLIPVKLEGEYVSVTGFIGMPQLAQRKTTHQYVFINNRYTQYPEIQKAIKESYKTLLEPHAQPVFFIHIAVPQHMLDLNIDPKKEKLHIYHLSEVIKTMYDGITELLSNNDVHYSLGAGLSDSGMEAYTAHSLRKQVRPWSLKNLKKNTEIAQFHDTYLMAQIDDGLIMIDQHAAHERILYEQFLAEFENQRSFQHTVSLDTSEIIKFSAVEYALVIEYAKMLEAHGFRFNKLIDENKIAVLQIPQLFQTRNVKEFILELCEDWQLLLPTEKTDYISHKTIAYLACRSAIKAGERLTPEERSNLFKKLAETKTQYTCPHGRPVQVTISLYELEKMFHRK